jgi:hypothetical protein
MALTWSTPAAALPGSNPGSGSATAAGADAVVIQEFTPAGLFATDDEYLLVRNLDNQAVDLDGWSLQACTPNGPAFTIVLGGGEITAAGFLLIAGDGYSGFVSRDIGYSSDVPDDGGWRILDELGGHVDGVGLTEDLPCTEGDPAAHCDWESGEAISRDVDGTDTDNNRDDFACQARSR